MSSLSETWLQEVAKRNGLPPLRPAVAKALLPVVEMQLRKIVQQGYKFTRRGKSSKLTVEDVNQALELYKLEPIYGLAGDQRRALSTSLSSSSSSGVGGVGALGDNGVVSLVQLARAPLPKLPLLPELSLHWLAVEGVQPLIPENPSQTVAADAGDNPSSLPRELQQFYMRVTGVLLAAEGGDRPLKAVLTALREDSGLQDLVPYFSRFIYHHVKANTRALPLLRTLISAVQALLSNPGIRIEFHLQQLLPAIFTAIVSAKLSSSPYEDHWSLREQAAAVVAAACVKYSSVIPDLQARVCRTYLDALHPDRSLATLCGGLLGLSALGQSVVRSLLLPHVDSIGDRLELVLQRRVAPTPAGGGADGGVSSEKVNVDNISAEMCLSALAHALGSYLAYSIRLGTAPIASVSATAGAEASAAAGAAPSKKPKTAGGDRVGRRSVVAGLEEVLVPHYASTAASAAHLRLFI